MDTPRAWQVASLATAVAGLGMGGMLLGRPAIDEVASIDLDVLVPSTFETSSEPLTTATETPQIVDAAVVGPDGEAAATASTPGSTVTVESVASPEEPVVDAPKQPLPTPSADVAESPASVDSPSSLDS